MTRLADQYEYIAKRLAELEAEQTARINAPTAPERIGEQVQYLGKRYLWDGQQWIEQALECPSVDAVYGTGLCYDALYLHMQCDS